MFFQGLSVDAANDYEIFSLYIKNLSKDLKKKWHPQGANVISVTQILFELDKNGKLISSQVYKSSGSKNFDEKALNLVNSYKFPPLPKNYSKQSVQILFTFDYKSYYKQSSDANTVDAFCYNQSGNEILKEYAAKHAKEAALNWNPPAISSSKTNAETKIAFEINKSGIPVSQTILKSSKDIDFDASCEAAVSKMAFRPLPLGYEEETAQILFVFKSKLKN